MCAIYRNGLLGKRYRVGCSEQRASNALDATGEFRWGFWVSFMRLCADGPDAKGKERTSQLMHVIKELASSIYNSTYNAK